MFRPALFMLVAARAFALGGRGSAQAIILEGHPDRRAHPYVGLVTDGDSFCSGALISPTVFITAAHCFEKPGQEVSVTVDPDASIDNAKFASGPWFPNPKFSEAREPRLVGFATADVAVVILDEPINVASYAQLPTQDLVDTLPMRQRVHMVGYGVQDIVHKLGPGELLTRFRAPAELVQRTGPIADEFLTMTANPAQGMGGFCFGDSGGPILMSHTILAVHSFLTNSQGTGIAHSLRIDTAEALQFIQSVIATQP